jgi:anti-sigma regulatory factor (Ser/Thr protein kinase)
LASHLAVGLEKVRIHGELRAHRDQLDAVVAARTRSLKKAYDELRSVDVMKDRFLANVSHEMRSPLTVIIGAATYLRDYEGDAAEREEMVAGILRSSQALDRMIDGLLRVARLDTGEEPVVADVEPAHVVADALRLVGAEERTSVVLDHRVTTFPADASRLARALANLVDNALKFGPEDVPVELSVAPCVLNRPGGAVAGIAFAVLDRGPGLPRTTSIARSRPSSKAAIRSPANPKASASVCTRPAQSPVATAVRSSTCLAPTAGASSAFRYPPSLWRPPPPESPTVCEHASIHGVALGSDPLRMRDMGRWLERLVLEAGFTSEDARDLVVAFGETCANVHRHAYAGRVDGRVELRIAIDNERVIVTVEHAGEPFNPTAYEPPDLGRPSEAGYGVYLIRTLVDAVSFETTGTGGRIVLTKDKGRAVRPGAAISGGGHVGK